jgi:La domain
MRVFGGAAAFRRSRGSLSASACRLTLIFAFLVLLSFTLCNNSTTATTTTTTTLSATASEFIMNPPPFVMRPATSMPFQPCQAAAAQTTQGRAHSAATNHDDDDNNNNSISDDATLLSRLRRQVEFYFSDDNLRRDGYLQALLHSRDHYGLVPLATIASFGRVREMYASHRAGHHVPARFAAGPADPIVVARSLAKSERVRVSPDGHWLRPASTAWTIASSGNGNGGDPVAPHKGAVPGDDDNRTIHGRPALSVSVETKGTLTTTGSGSAATSPSITPTSFDSTEVAAAAAFDAAAGVSGAFERADQHHHHPTSPHQPRRGSSSGVLTTKSGPSANPPPDAVPSTVSVTPRRGGTPGGVGGGGGDGTAPPGPTPPQPPHYPAPQPLSMAIQSQMPYPAVPTTAYQPMIMTTYPNGMTTFMYPPQILPFPPHGGPPPAGPAMAQGPGPVAAASSPPSPPVQAYSPSQAPSAASHAHSPPQRGYVAPFHVPSQYYPPQKQQPQQQPPQPPPQNHPPQPPHNHMQQQQQQVQPPSPPNHYPQQQPQYHPQGFVAMANAGPPMMQHGEAFVPMFLPLQQHPYHHHHPNPSGPAPSTNTDAWASNVDSQQASSLRSSSTTTTATTNSHYPPAATVDVPFVALPQYAPYPGGYVAAVPAMGAVDSAGEFYYHNHHHHNYPYYAVNGPPFVATAFGMAEGGNADHVDDSYDPAYGYSAYATDAALHHGTKSDESGSRDTRPRRHQRATARGKDKNRDWDSAAPSSGPKLRGSSNSAAGSVTSVTSRSTVTTADVLVASAGRDSSAANPAVGEDSTVPATAEWVDVGRGPKGAAARSSSVPSTATSSAAAAAAAAMTKTAAPPPRIRAPKNKKKNVGGGGSKNNNGDNNNHAASSKPNRDNGTSSKSNGGKKVDVGNALSEEHFPALGSPKGKPGGTKAGQGGVAAAGSGGGETASGPRPSVPLPYAEAAKAKKRQDQPPKQAKQQQPKQQHLKPQDAAAASTSTPDDVTREMLGLSVDD